MPKAIILITVEPGSEDEVLASLKGIEGVKEVHHVYGVCDIVAMVEAQDDGNLKIILSERIRGMGKIRNTVTMMVA